MDLSYRDLTNSEFTDLKKNKKAYRKLITIYARKIQRKHRDWDFLDGFRFQVYVEEHVKYCRVCGDIMINFHCLNQHCSQSFKAQRKAQFGE